MTIILFLIDTSASMCQKVHVNGVQKTYLDVAKGAVETFLKFRQRSQDCMGDRYMLLTFEEPPSNVKAGWKENHATFMNELKNLQSNGLTCMGEALKNGFDLLNLNRMQSGIDTYGQGRCPFYLETSVIIVITDGGKYSFRNGVHNEIVLPLHAQIPGTKLTKEPFRWDQRLFSLVLRMAGHRVDERIDVKVPHDDSPIEKMCEVTGGRSYKVRSHYVLNHCIESLVQKVQAGVVVQFEQSLPPTPSKEIKLEGEHPMELLFPTTKKMIYVQKNMSNKNYPIGYWPLPEPYWPDPKAVQLPPRDAHPRIRIISSCVDEPVPVRNFPVDKYELEPSALTMQILARREMTRCWPVVVVNSGGGAPLGPGGVPLQPPHDLPFGYLKANNTFTQVYLVVLPINYPVLLPLLHDLLHRYMGNPPNEWMYKFTNYVRSIPQYYCPFLRRALASISVPYQLLSYIIPENLDSYLSQQVANHLKALKNAAKQDLEALCMRIFKQLKHPKPPHRQVETAKLLPMIGQPPGVGVATNQQPIGGARKDMVSHPMLRDTFAKVHSECQFHENYTVVVPVATIRGQLTGSSAVTHASGGAGGNGQSQNGLGGGVAAARASRNPFDIRRRDLVDEISRMRENFFKMVAPSGGLAIGAGLTAGVNGAAGHCLPISEMGNYQEYLKNKETPLREIEPTNVRQHMFGNPYKKDKHMVMVDEADMVGDVAPMMKTSGAGGGGIPGGGPGGGPMMMNKKMGEGGMLPKMSRKRKAGPIARDYKFRRLSTSSMESYGSRSPSQSDYSSDGGSSMASDDFDDEEQRLVMDFEENYKEPQGTAAITGSEESGDVPSGGVGETLPEVKIEGRLNGAGGGLMIKEERGSEEIASDRHIHTPVPVVLTPSEGVLSPVYLPFSVTFPTAPGAGASAPLITSAAIGVITSQNAAAGVIQSPAGGGVGSIPSIASLIGSGSGLGTQQPTSIITSGSVTTSSTEIRKHLPNGTTNANATIRETSSSIGGGIPVSPSVAPVLERSTSSASSSNYNDADAISKILQQSCSQHNGGSGESERERKKLSSSSNRNNEDEENTATTTSSSTSSSSTGGGGRKRRQMTKQASSELLESPDSKDDPSLDGEASSATSGTNRRQSPRMGKGKDAEAENHTNHTTTNKSGWASSRRKGANHHPGGKDKNHKQAVPAAEDQEGEEDGVDDEKTNAWLPNGEHRDVIRESNFEARTVLFHDIRRPGRDYGQLLEHLEMVRGDFETQFAFIQMCIAEAMRFHRKKMATTIQEWWDMKIDRITRGGGDIGACGEPAVVVAAAAAAAAETVVKVVTTTTTSGKSRKSNVKLRSGTGSTVPASKC